MTYLIYHDCSGSEFRMRTIVSYFTFHFHVLSFKLLQLSRGAKSHACHLSAFIISNNRTETGFQLGKRLGMVERSCDIRSSVSTPHCHHQHHHQDHTPSKLRASTVVCGLMRPRRGLAPSTIAANCIRQEIDNQKM